MQREIQQLILKALQDLQKEKVFEGFDIGKIKKEEIEVDYTKDEQFGDYTSNVAMILANRLKKKPLDIAEKIARNANKRHANDNKNNKENINDIYKIFEKIEVKAPGYLNFYLAKDYLRGLVRKINEEKENYGSSDLGKKEKILVEFISANPTGPIHLGNARGGPLGDTLVNILNKVGYDALREYYVNDFGNQIKILGHSILKDEGVQYRGDYIDELSKRNRETDPYKAGEWGASEILENIIKPATANLGITFNNWFLEKNLHESGAVDEIIEEFKKQDYIYEKDGAWWFRTMGFGDDKDRVVIKSTGEKTYFAADIAYHKNKFSRGISRAINIWGADHWGDLKRIESALEILELKDKVDFLFTQFVRVIEDGKEIKMSKRHGHYIALSDLIDEVGKDVVRFIFLMYSADTHVNFDLNLAKEASDKNPVYYVQYAHARICSLLNRGTSPAYAGHSAEINSVKNTEHSAEKTRKKDENINNDELDLSLLTHEKELSLIRHLEKFPELIKEISEEYNVHKLPHYAIKLADKFHSFYAVCRVNDADNQDCSLARQELVKAVRIVLKESFRIMGIDASEKM